jgi:excisionase family DNA binding protein
MAELMTVDEVADYLRVTDKTVYRLLDKGSIPAAKVGHKWRFKRESIDHWLYKDEAKKVANILVIDDDDAICSLFKDTLDGAGHKVTAVSDSSLGLELAKLQDYDLVFLDLKMPGLDGAELLKQIRLTKPTLPIMIVTGYQDSDLMMSALAHGPLGVMVKPFKVAEILTAVNNYLRFGMSTKK